MKFICPEGVLSEEEWFRGTAGLVQGFCSSCDFEELFRLKTLVVTLQDGTENRKHHKYFACPAFKVALPDCLGEQVGATESCFMGNIDLFVVVVPNRNEKCKFLVKQTFLRAALEN